MDIVNLIDVLRVNFEGFKVDLTETADRRQYLSLELELKVPIDSEPRIYYNQVVDKLINTPAVQDEMRHLRSKALDAEVELEQVLETIDNLRQYKNYYDLEFKLRGAGSND